MSPFICPLCQSHFLPKLITHKFVKIIITLISLKEGYLNLLPVNAKNSKNPGDNKEMMMARRSFLDSEGYLPLAEKLSSIANKLLIDISNPTLLDLGCGEGYYTHFLAENLPNSATINALDISKIAIRYAAKRYKKINFCVASAYDVPLTSNSLDALIRIYAPSLESELQRLIKTNGYLITVTPAPRHLFELRTKIYEQVNEHISENEAPVGFVKIEQVNLNYSLNISNAQILKDLIQMTPFAWKFTAQKMQDLLDEKQWEIECDFNIEVYKKD